MYSDFLEREKERRYKNDRMCLVCVTNIYKTYKYLT